MAQIDIPNFPSNSIAKANNQNQQTQQPGASPKPTRIVTPLSDMKPHMEKKSIGDIARNAMANPVVAKTRDTAIEKIVLPNLQRTLYSVVDLIVRAVIFKDQAQQPSNYNPFVTTGYGYGGYGGVTNYGSFYNNPQPVSTATPRVKAMTRNETLRVHDLQFETRDEAMYVKTELEKYLQQYGKVDAAYVNVITGRSTGIIPTANEYGWRDLSQAYIQDLPNNAAWLILPEAEHLL